MKEICVKLLRKLLEKPLAKMVDKDYEALNLLSKGEMKVKDKKDD